MIACGKVIFAPIVVIAHNRLDYGLILAKHLVNHALICFKCKVRTFVTDIARKQDHTNTVVFQFFKRSSEMSDI